MIYFSVQNTLNILATFMVTSLITASLTLGGMRSAPEPDGHASIVQEYGIIPPTNPRISYPVLPMSLLKSGREALVVMSYTVMKNGFVKPNSIRIIRGGGTVQFDELARETLLQSSFEPAQKNGKATVFKDGLFALAFIPDAFGKDTTYDIIPLSQTDARRVLDNDLTLADLRTPPKDGDVDFINPAFARIQRSERRGEVILKFDVARDGLVINDSITVVKANGSRFRRSALRALRSSLFRPRIVDGKAVKAEGIEVRYVFEPSRFDRYRVGPILSTNTTRSVTLAPGQLPAGVDPDNSATAGLTPYLISDVSISFPKTAAKKKLFANTVFMFDVSTSGTVDPETIQLLAQQGDPSLVKLAQESISSLKFLPVKVNDKAIAFKDIVHTIAFTYQATSKDLIPVVRTFQHRETMMKVMGQRPPPRAALIALQDSIRVDYPLSAGSRGTRGFVDLAYKIEKDGSVDKKSIRILASEPEGVFERAVKRGIGRIKYLPRTMNGKPASIDGIVIRITFDALER